jgi:hypothetical protein
MVLVRLLVKVTVGTIVTTRFCITPGQPPMEEFGVIE